MARTPLPVDNSAYTVNNSVIQNSLGMHLDMTDAGDEVDVSSHSVTVDPGDTFLAWCKFTQIGTSDSDYGPGIVAGATDAFDDFFSVRNDSSDASPVTSGTCSTNFTFETADGEFASSDAFNYDLDNNPWILVGYAYDSNEAMTWFHNDSTLAVRNSHDTTGTKCNVNRIGYGYGGSTSDGALGKYMDSPGVWNSVLSTTETGDWYNNGNVPDSPANIWHFNDDSDTSTAVDSAGSADGTINGATYVEGNAF